MGKFVFKVAINPWKRWGLRCCGVHQECSATRFYNPRKISKISSPFSPLEGHAGRSRFAAVLESAKGA